MSYFHAALDGYYQLGETIGSGGFAKVKAAYHTLTGEKVAIKIMTKAELGEDLPRVKNEIEALKTIEHSHICQLYQVIDTAERYYLVMEYCPGGELFDYIVEKDRLDEREARQLFRQIVSAVGHLHRLGFAHRDLKPENILIDDEQAMKLIDFGLCARPLGGAGGILDTCCGSPAYAAPELVSQQQYCGSAADVWSLGVLLYALLCGFLPFEDLSLPALYKKIQRGQFEIPAWLSPAAVDLLQSMMDTRPCRRISVGRLAEHAWVTDAGREAPVAFDGEPESAAARAASERCLAELSLCCRRPRREILAALALDRFDYLTATFRIMRRRQLRGLSLRLADAGSLPAVGAHFTTSLAHNLIPQPQFDCSFLEEKPIPRARCRQLPAAGESPLKLSAPQQQQPKETPICGVAMIGGKEPAARHEDDKENFVVPLTPVRVGRPRYKAPANANANANAVGGSSTLSPSRSVDSALHQQAGGCAGTAPSSPLPPTPPRTPRSVFGSLERLGGRVRQAFTPKRRPGPGGSCDSGPRKLSAFHNVTTTEECHPQAVLNKLLLALQERSIRYKKTGYLLRCQVCDDWGKVNLAFDLEVCCLSKQDGVGVRRKRVKGDSWHYKRLCEDILHTAQLQ